MGRSIIRLKTLSAGPEGVLQPGTEIAIDSDVAQQMITAGYAELVEVEAEPEPEPKAEAPKPRKIEHAVVAPPEDAAAGPSRRKQP